MDETRRFLRYLVPTLVFVTELALLLVVGQQGEMLHRVYAQLKESSAGFAALAVAVAGALGYLCSLIHHTLSWLPCGYGINYTKFVRAAVDNQWLTLQTDKAQVHVESQQISREMAWDVVTLLWYRPGGTNSAQDPELGKALVSRLDAMSDLMHGLGTCVIASVFLIPAWMLLSFWSFWPHSWLHTASVIILAVLLALLHFSNYRRVRNRLYKLVQNTLATYLARVRPGLVVFVQDLALPARAQQGGKTACTPIEPPATESPQH